HAVGVLEREHRRPMGNVQALEVSAVAQVEGQMRVVDLEELREARRVVPSATGAYARESQAGCLPPAERRLLASALDVVLHELFGVLFQPLVDLVDERIHFVLELLALLGELLRPRALFIAGVVTALLRYLLLAAL